MAQAIDDQLGAVADEILAGLPKKRAAAPPAQRTDEEIGSVADEILSELPLYKPSPLEKAAIGYSEGIATLAQGPELAVQALGKVIPPEILERHIPMIVHGAQKAAEFGRFIEQDAQEAAPSNQRGGSIGAQLPYVAGTTAPLMIAGQLGPLSVAATGAAQSGIAMHRDILAATGDEAKAWTGLALGLGIGATEAIGAGPILSKLDKFTEGGLGRFLVQVATETIEEGAQETTQQALQDAAETALTPKEMTFLQRLESAGKAGALGLVFGGLTAGSVGGLTHGAAHAFTDEAPPAPSPQPGHKTIEQVSDEARAEAQRNATQQPEAATVAEEPARVAQTAEGAPAPVGGSNPPSAGSTEPKTYAHTEEPASNSSVQPGDELGPVEVVPIAELREFNPNKRVEAGKVAEIAQAMREGKPLPPVIAHQEGDQRVLDDGSTRIAAAQELGLDAVPVRMVTYADDVAKRAKEQPAREEKPTTRTADLVSAMRGLVQEHERADEDAGEDLPAAIQTAERVLDQRRAANIPPTELDDTLKDLLDATKVVPSEDFGSTKEQAQTRYMQAAVTKARATLDVFDAAKRAARPRSDEDLAADRVMRGEHLSLDEMTATPKAIEKAARRLGRGETPPANPEQVTEAAKKLEEPKPTPPVASEKAERGVQSWMDHMAREAAAEGLADELIHQEEQGKSSPKTLVEPFFSNGGAYEAMNEEGRAALAKAVKKMTGQEVGSVAWVRNGGTPQQEVHHYSSTREIIEDWAADSSFSDMKADNRRLFGLFMQIAEAQRQHQAGVNPFTQRREALPKPTPPGTRETATPAAHGEDFDEMHRREMEALARDFPETEEDREADRENLAQLERVDRAVDAVAPRSAKNTRAVIYRALGLPDATDPVFGHKVDPYFRIGTTRMGEHTADLRKHAQKIAEAIFRDRAEAQGLDPDGLLGPMSGLSQTGKANRIREASEAAQRIVESLEGQLASSPHVLSESTPPAPVRETEPPAAQAAPTIATEAPLGVAEGAGGPSSVTRESAGQGVASPLSADRPASAAPSTGPGTDKSLREFIRSIGGLHYTGNLAPFTRTELGERRTIRRRDPRSGKAVEVRINTRANPIVHEEGIPRGIPLDEATEAAWEAGYFPERPTPNELIEALHADATHPGSSVRPPTPQEMAASDAREQMQDLAQRLAEGDLGPIELMAFPGGALDSVVRDAKKLIERLRRTPPVQEGAVPFPMQRATERAVQRYVDYFEPVARAERFASGEKRPGEANLPDQEDAYLQETLRRGRAKAQLDKLESDEQKPMLALLRSKRVSLAEADDYLLARHAEERNAVVAARQPAVRELESKIKKAIAGGAEGTSDEVQLLQAELDAKISELVDHGIGVGMSNHEAQEILSKVETDPRRAAFEELGARFDSLNAKTRALWVKTGLTSQETVDHLERQFKRYAPARTDMTADGQPMPALARLKRVGRPFQKALGRRSRPDSPLAFAFAQAEQAIQRGEVNRVRRAFLSFARAYGDKLGDAIKVVDVPTRRTLVNGFVQDTYDAGFMNRHDVVTVREGDKTIGIEVAPEHADLAKALNQLGPEQVEGASRLVAAFNRMRGALITRYRPFFWPFNMVRDVKGAFYAGNEFGARFATKLVTSVPKAALTLAGKETTLSPYVERYRAAGAPISFMGLSDYSTQLDKIQGALSDPDTSTGARSVQGFRLLKDAMDRASDLGENATRFSAFVHAIEDLGFTDERAAAYAKELQNFERKGLWGNHVNAWYLFANAGVQASRRFAQAMRNPGVRKVVAASFLASMGWDSLMRAIGGQAPDGEDWWDKIPDYEKQGNFVFLYPDGSGRRVTIPAPFVFGAFNYSGQQLGAYASGNIGLGKLLASTSDAWVNALNPLGSISGEDGGGLVRALTPDVARLPLEIVTNRDWRGKPIAPTEYDHRQPDSERFFPDVNPQAKALAQWLSHATGGDKYEPGAVDVSPETLEHVATFFGSGLPQDLLNVREFLGKLATGAPITTRETPLLKRIVRDPSPFQSWTEQQDLLFTLTAEEKRAEDENRSLPEHTRAVIELGKSVEKERERVQHPKKDSGSTPLDSMDDAAKQKKLQELDLQAQKWNRSAREALRTIKP